MIFFIFKIHFWHQHIKTIQKHKKKIEAKKKFKNFQKRGRDCNVKQDLILQK
jgi:hypothetical protein